MCRGYWRSRWTKLHHRPRLNVDQHCRPQTLVRHSTPPCWWCYFTHQRAPNTHTVLGRDTISCVVFDISTALKWRHAVIATILTHSEMERFSEMKPICWEKKPSQYEAQTSLWWHSLRTEHSEFWWTQRGTIHYGCQEGAYSLTIWNGVYMTVMSTWSMLYTECRLSVVKVQCVQSSLYSHATCDE